MKKKNGFTLIELMAVIIILAITALIVMPMIFKTISKAKVKSAEDAAYGIRKEAQILQKNALLNTGGTYSYIEIDFELLDSDGMPITNLYKTLSSTPETNIVKFNVNGRLPDSGKLIIYGGGNMEFKDIVIDNFSCIIPETGDISCDKESNLTYVYYNNADSHNIIFIGDTIDINNLSTGYYKTVDEAVNNHNIYIRHTIQDRKITKSEICINKSEWDGELCIDVNDNTETNQTKILKHFGYNETTGKSKFTGVTCQKDKLNAPFTLCGDLSFFGGTEVRMENNLKSAYFKNQDDNGFTCHIDRDTLNNESRKFFSWCTNE